VANEFDQLLPCKWRDIEFPIRSVDVSFEQDLVEHKYYGVDGARVEATGRGPLRITVAIPLSNGIVPGKNEKWGVLYPDAFRTLMRAAADRSVGIFQHPELDEIPCRVKSVSTKHDGGQRDGVDLVISFVETVLDNSTSDFIAGESPVASAELGALDLDASSDDITALVPDAYEMPFTITDFVNSLTAISDQFSIQSKLAFGKIDGFLYHLDRLGDSIDAARNVQTWPAIDAINKAKSALHWVKNNPPGGLPVLKWTVGADVSLAALVGEIPGAQMGDIVKLNRGIMNTAVVKQGTVVRYHDRSK
jgi:hypothetical protein